ncbi:MarR family winged helix-turn-helix transcriptional regulator [Catellatospora sp. KI3]|uniref:MarR family winged helix-turn-helix transcriptional regulator n=1 Tax=Catellatospora sp. KI3 TaxID=3041620 RepID=UPI00248328A7|nr:MarR family winged helix-turn-helix transcriptional regulator [Catellatospora sp. KI3]MDI1462652.1 MarR family winged helix-turn-helix transcriptional regulator [Catellatospora sp. KI3]
MHEHDESSLPEAFWGVARQLRHLTKDALAPWQVSPSQARALGVLGKEDALRLNVLAEQLRIAPRSVTEVVDDLEARGLVERRADPADRRATLVALTGPGRETVAAIGAARRAEADRFFGTLSPADRAHLIRILKQLAT